MEGNGRQFEAAAADIKFSKKNRDFAAGFATNFECY
jgi:hypothetical protein